MRPYTSRISSLSPSKNDSAYQWFVLALATLSQTSISYVGQGVAAIAPVLQMSFHLSTTQVGMAVSANNVGIGLTALTFGAIVDRFGDKRVMVLGGLMTGVTILVATRASDYGVLLTLLIATGMWTGGATPSGSKAIFNHFDPQTRGTAMGIRQMGVTAGGLIASLTLPLIAAGLHWQRSFEFAAAIVIAVSLGCQVFYRDRSRRNSASRASTAGEPMVLLIAASIIVLSLLMLLGPWAMPWWLLAILFALMGLMSMGRNGLWVTWVSELVDPADSGSALGAAMSLLQAGVLVYPTPSASLSTTSTRTRAVACSA